ncbi:COG2426 family protein [Streptococcus caviae]|uniref:COG2426 family protein n=1 Tax=Streptococcus sp. 'caviae' TaxID=1915004 RepID=UPI00094BA8D4|nr:small multi-drug export protein [Streptococcus sp. 'caviae']OLN83020.1 small multidrug export protein [Streptococcus sp. 'caviae']
MKKYLLTFLISMVPIVELRGAVPFGVAYNLPVWQAIMIGVIGNILPVPIIFFFARRVLELGVDKPVIGSFFNWCLKKGHSGGQKLVESAGSKGLYFALFFFVGIPLPGTGVWTGTLAASILDLKFKNSIITVVSGGILAGFIMGFGSVFIKGLI